MNGLQHASAFVVQFRSVADEHGGDLAGWVEHVASGRTATFESVQELPGRLTRMLIEVAKQAQSTAETSERYTKQTGSAK